MLLAFFEFRVAKSTAFWLLEDCRPLT